MCGGANAAYVRYTLRCLCMCVGLTAHFRVALIFSNCSHVFLLCVLSHGRPGLFDLVAVWLTVWFGRRVDASTVICVCVGGGRLQKQQRRQPKKKTVEGWWWWWMATHPIGRIINRCSDVRASHSRCCSLQGHWHLLDAIARKVRLIRGNHNNTLFVDHILFENANKFIGQFGKRKYSLS